jgi:hypothetical protein
MWNDKIKVNGESASTRKQATIKVLSQYSNMLWKQRVHGRFQKNMMIIVFWYMMPFSLYNEDGSNTHHRNLPIYHTTRCHITKTSTSEKLSKEVNGQLHAPAALFPGIQSRYTSERRLSALTVGTDDVENRKIIFPYRESSQGSSVVLPVAQSLHWLSYLASH